MLRINFLVGVRNLLKRKGYVIVNTLGLSIGLTSCILIVLFIQNQFSFDQSFPDADRIYRMKELKTVAGDKRSSGVVPYSFARILVRDYPEVENATVFAGPFEQQVSVANGIRPNAHFLEEGVLLADSTFFHVLEFRLIRGTARSALVTPESVVLTKSTAEKYFGDLDPLGQVISLGRRSCVVTAVCDDPPVNSHFKFSLLISSLSFKWLNHDQFNLKRAYCYLKLKPKSEAARLEAKFPEMVNTYVGAEVARVNKVSWEDYRAAGNDYQYSLQPITSIHLDAEVSNGMKAGGNPTTLHVLMGVALFIFIIACINFMNLSTARSMERAREVGVRKVLGSLKFELILQFLTESLLLTTLAVFGAILLSYSLLPIFSVFVETQIHLEWSLYTISIFMLITVVVTVVSGLYPAFVLSSYKPLIVLKGTFSSQPKGKLLKNAMIIFQFWISIVLITSTIIIYMQVDFMKTKSLGFDKDELLVIEGIFNMNPNYAQPFLEEIRNHAEVKVANGTLWVQGFQGTWSDEYKSAERAEVISMNRVIIGDGVGELLGLQLLEGSFFSDQTHDSLSVLLNSSAVKAMGLDNPIGKKLAMINHEGGAMDYEYFTIKGVIEDFHYQSLRSDIEPLVILSSDYFYGRMSFILTKLSSEGNQNTIADLEAIWQKHFPNKPFSWRFMDKVLEDHYKSERKLTTIFVVFSSISIILSSVGLLALLSYSIRSRRREMSIRKVIGATLANMIILLSKDFSKMIVTSFLLAVPITLYCMHRWLEGFAYRISITAEFFILSGVAIAVLASCILLFQGVQAAKSKPIDVLRSE